MFSSVRRLGTVLRSEGGVYDHVLGEPSRLGYLRLALRPARTDPSRLGDEVLFDYSAQKVGGTEEMFGRRVPVVNPYECFKGLRLRLLLVLTLFLTRERQRALAASIVAHAVTGQVGGIRRSFLWNPGNLVSLALAHTLPNVNVYVLAPEYPLVERAELFFSNETVLDIHQIPTAQRRVVRRQHDFVSDDLKFVFYPSQLSTVGNELFEEMLLFDLFRDVAASATIPIEIRPHYHDQKHGLPTWFLDEFGDHVVFSQPNSLGCLSTRQVSFSCHSSIGYELIGLGVVHGIIGPLPGGMRERHSCPALNRWFRASPFVLSATDLASWPQRMSDAFPSQLSRHPDLLSLSDRVVAEL